MLIGVVTMEEEVALVEVFQGKEGVIRIMVVIGTMDLWSSSRACYNGSDINNMTWLLVNL